MRRGNSAALHAWRGTLTERKVAEEQLRKIAVELEQRVSEADAGAPRISNAARELATELTLTEQRERRRLAGDLHDYLAQLLVLIRIKIHPDLRPG